MTRDRASKYRKVREEERMSLDQETEDLDRGGWTAVRMNARPKTARIYPQEIQVRYGYKTWRPWRIEEINWAGFSYFLPNPLYDAMTSLSRLSLAIDSVFPIPKSPSLNIVSHYLYTEILCRCQTALSMFTSVFSLSFPITSTFRFTTSLNVFNCFVSSSCFLDHQSKRN